MASPKYLLGESYGERELGRFWRCWPYAPEGAIRFSGVTLISPWAWNGYSEYLRAGFQCSRDAEVPSEAVAAWYNHRGGHLFRSLEQVAQAAQTFAMG